jgi:DNA (cytosine-5)-methyltransferase 1
MTAVTLEGNGLRSAREKLGLSQAKLAELTGIPQAALSSFELGKSALPSKAAETISRLLSQDGKIKGLVERKKRYRLHEYAAPQRDPARIKLAVQTQANLEYVELLSKLDRNRVYPQPNRPKALSLFSGCGGFSTGFSWAGFEILGFVELEGDFRRIYRDNFPHTEELGSDITGVSDSQIEGWKQKFGIVDVIIGGPPCQGFSLSGKRRADDPRNSLFQHYLRVVECIQPKVAVLENVRLLTSMRFPDGSLVATAIRDGFAAKGYEVRAFEINAKDYGVPQHRERVIFVAVRRDIALMPSIPAPSHGIQGDLFGGSVPHRTFADACSDLEFLESGEKSVDDELHEAVHHPKHVIDWLWNVPQGASAHDNEDPALRPPSGYNTTYKRQIWQEPAGTVQTTFGMISGCRNVHPIATRALTVREAARLQSFPDSFQFRGSLNAVRTSIGNAVPPLLACALGRHVRGQFLNLVEVASL